MVTSQEGFRMNTLKTSPAKAALGRIFLLFVLTSADCLAAPGEKAQTPERLFRDNFIPAISIQINGAGMSSLERSPRKYVPATIQAGGSVYTNVSIRLKGGPGSF